MKKIPTIFKRDDKGQITRDWHPDCLWVRDGQGVATRKYDGTCVLYRDGRLFKRREIKRGKRIPDDFDEVDYDPQTGKKFGWVPVGDGPEDKWLRKALEGAPTALASGTYEAIGPKIQGNPEAFDKHMLVRHGFQVLLPEPERTFDAIAAFLEERNIEGIVWHNHDGRMAKIKGKDFGISRRTA